MTDGRLLLVALVLVAVVALGGPTVVTAVARGRRLTAAEAPRGGYIDRAPSELAASAGLSLDVYSLARVIASEAGSSPAVVREAVAWIVRNEARARGWTITALVTHGTVGAGRYAAQNAGGRYVSTRLDPRRADADLAAAVLSDRVSDPTGGARRFFSPSAQDALADRGEPGYRSRAANVYAAWTRAGWRPVDIPGSDPRRFVAFRRATAA